MTPKRDLDERIKIDLDPETAMKLLLKVDPDADPELTDEEIAQAIEQAIKDDGA